MTDNPSIPLPRDLFDRVRAFGEHRGLTFERALRVLIERGAAAPEPEPSSADVCFTVYDDDPDNVVYRGSALPGPAGKVGRSSKWGSGQGDDRKPSMLAVLLHDHAVIIRKEIEAAGGEITEERVVLEVKKRWPGFWGREDVGSLKSRLRDASRQAKKLDV